MRLPNWIFVFCALVLTMSQYTASANLNSNALNLQSIDKNESITLVNINKANAQELASLPGLGAKKALAIIEYRELNGSFSETAELVNVKGIGPKLLAKIEAYIAI